MDGVELTLLNAHHHQFAQLVIKCVLIKLVLETAQIQKILNVFKDLVLILLVAHQMNINVKINHVYLTLIYVQLENHVTKQDKFFVLIILVLILNLIAVFLKNVQADKYYVLINHVSS
jgi:hypothetical protein